MQKIGNLRASTADAPLPQLLMYQIKV